MKEKSRLRGMLLAMAIAMLPAFAFADANLYPIGAQAPNLAGGVSSAQVPNAVMRSAGRSAHGYHNATHAAYNVSSLYGSAQSANYSGSALHMSGNNRTASYGNTGVYGSGNNHSVTATNTPQQNMSSHRMTGAGMLYRRSLSFASDYEYEGLPIDADNVNVANRRNLPGTGTGAGEDVDPGDLPHYGEDGPIGSSWPLFLFAALCGLIKITRLKHSKAEVTEE